MDDASLGRVVAGIASYTYWPVPKRLLTLCLLPGARWSGALDPRLLPPGGAQITVSRPVHTDHAALAPCDILYAGPLNLPDTRALYASVADHPVLTLTEGDSACVQGSMFCLKANAGHTGFSINLDAVSRSGLRISPAVLQLGHPGPAVKGSAGS